MQFFNVFLVPLVGLIIILIDYYNRYPADAVQKRLITLLIAFLIATILCDLTFAVVNGVSGDFLRIVNLVACTLYFLLMSISFGLIIMLFEHSLNGNGTSLRKIAIAIVVSNIIYAVMLVSNLFTNKFFYITFDNFYERSYLYMAAFAIPILLAFLMLLNVFLNRKNVNMKMFVLALISTMPLVIASILDVFLTESLLVWQGFFISVLFFYLFIIHKVALIDNLTNLHNRRGLDEYLQSLAKFSRRKPYVFLMIDMDKFKEINDQFGHAQGDSALRDTADILRFSVRRDDFIARYGGDEFVIIAAADNADALIRNITTRVDEFNARQTKPYKLVLSCGGDVYRPDDIRPFSEFLNHIDTLMYAEKERRR